jgi:hypothetical protein
MPTPAECANFFEAALKRYCEITTIAKAPDSCDIQDLLTDAMHYCKYHKLDFDYIVQSAENRFDEEKQEPFIHLNEAEHIGKSDCGCYLEIMSNGNPAFFMCEDHAKGFEYYQQRFKG